MQLPECGHRYCQTCLDIEQETTIKCQRCQAETLKSDIIRGEMQDHYSTQQHQHALLN
ncbi:unnamed protein product, partial [Rotaria sordida]